MDPNKSLLDSIRDILRETQKEYKKRTRSGDRPIIRELPPETPSHLKRKTPEGYLSDPRNIELIKQSKPGAESQLPPGDYTKTVSKFSRSKGQGNNNG